MKSENNAAALLMARGRHGMSSGWPVGGVAERRRVCVARRNWCRARATRQPSSWRAADAA